MHLGISQNTKKVTLFP